MISIALVGTARHYVHTGDIDIQIPTPKHHEAFAVNYVMGLLGGVFPDYVALGKGRLLIGIANLIDGMSAVVVLIASDIALSCLISLFTSGFVFLCYTTGGEIRYSCLLGGTPGCDRTPRHRYGCISLGICRRTNTATRLRRRLFPPCLPQSGRPSSCYPPPLSSCLPRFNDLPDGSSMLESSGAGHRHRRWRPGDERRTNLDSATSGDLTPCRTARWPMSEIS